jgi:hypothetical protein
MFSTFAENGLGKIAQAHESGLKNVAQEVGKIAQAHASGLKSVGEGITIGLNSVGEGLTTGMGKIAISLVFCSLITGNLFIFF